MSNYNPMNHEQRANVGRLIYEAKFASPDIEWVGLGKKYGISAGYAYKLARDHAQSNSLPWTVMANGKPAFPGAKRKTVRQCHTVIDPEPIVLSNTTLIALLRARAEKYRQERNDIAAELDRLKDRYGKLDSIVEEMSDLIKSLEDE